MTVDWVGFALARARDSRMSVLVCSSVPSTLECVPQGQSSVLECLCDTCDS